MKFSFTPLGIASALPTVNRNPGAHVLNLHERLFLIDCGEGCQLQLRRRNISFLKIQNIFISHIHGDHIFGLLGLLSSMSLIGRTEDIYIYGPAQLKKVLDFIVETFGDQFKFKIVHNVITMKSPQIIYETKSIEVLAFRLNHRIECFGYIFREKMPKRNVYKEKVDELSLTLKEIASLKNSSDVVREDGEVLSHEKLTYLPYNPRSFAYCSDTAPFNELPEYIKDVSMLYHEATFMEDMEKMAKETFHSTASQAAEIARKAGVKRLILGHFSSRYNNLSPLLKEAKAIFPESYLAEEGTEIEVPF